MHYFIHLYWWVLAQYRQVPFSPNSELLNHIKELSRKGVVHGRLLHKQQGGSFMTLVVSWGHCRIMLLVCPLITEYSVTQAVLDLLKEWLRYLVEKFILKKQGVCEVQANGQLVWVEKKMILLFNLSSVSLVHIWLYTGKKGLHIRSKNKTYQKLFHSTSFVAIIQLLVLVDVAVLRGAPFFKKFWYH